MIRFCIEIFLETGFCKQQDFSFSFVVPFVGFVFRFVSKQASMNKILASVFFVGFVLRFVSKQVSVNNKILISVLCVPLVSFMVVRGK